MADGSKAQFENILRCQDKKKYLFQLLECDNIVILFCFFYFISLFVKFRLTNHVIETPQLGFSETLHLMSLIVQVCIQAIGAGNPALLISRGTDSLTRCREARRSND